MNLVKSKQRVADHGEVFTPEWMVEAMLDLVNTPHFPALWSVTIALLGASRREQIPGRN
jgi:hypothetical protein